MLRRYYILVLYPGYFLPHLNNFAPMCESILGDLLSRLLTGCRGSGLWVWSSSSYSWRHLSFVYLDYTINQTVGGMSLLLASGVHRWSMIARQEQSKRLTRQNRKCLVIRNKINQEINVNKITSSEKYRLLMIRRETTTANVTRPWVMRKKIIITDIDFERKKNKKY